MERRQDAKFHAGRASAGDVHPGSPSQQGEGSTRDPTHEPSSLPEEVREQKEKHVKGNKTRMPEQGAHGASEGALPQGAQTR